MYINLTLLNEKKVLDSLLTSIQIKYENLFDSIGSCRNSSSIEVTNFQLPFSL